VETFLTEALERGELDQARLAQVLSDFPDAADHVRLLRARFDAIHRFSSFDDDAYLEARAAYRSLNPPMRPGQPFLEEAVTGACLNLLTLLGFGLRIPVH
jgi:hypothetical protein